jgi:hypothetical protein
MATSFPLLGKEIAFSDAREEYNALRREYAELAAGQAAAFAGDYLTHNRSLADVYHNVRQQGLSRIDGACEYSLRRLAAKGLRGIDRARFWSAYYGRHCDWEATVKRVTVRYEEIMLGRQPSTGLGESLAGAAEAQVMSGVGSLLGRAFSSAGGAALAGAGLGGALAGAAQAGAMTAIGGAIHGARGAVGRAVSTAGATIRLNQVFHDPQTLATLEMGLERAVFAMHLAVQQALRDHGLTTAEAVGSEPARRAAAMFGRLVDGSVPEADAARVLTEIVGLDPYEPRYLALVVDRFGDSGLEVSRLAAYLGLEEVERFKKLKLARQLEGLPLSPRAEAVKSLERAREYAAALGLEPQGPWFEMAEGS